MKKWVDFYTTVFGMQVTRYFDIKGQKTGLQSEVVQLANSAVIIPINEPDVENGKSQIQEFLDRHKGAGVQHIALTSADIISTVGDLQSRGIRFLDILQRITSKFQAEVSMSKRISPNWKKLNCWLTGIARDISSKTLLTPMSGLSF